MAYGPVMTEINQRVATYVHKILKGAKPADLPVEQPTRFDLVVNLKTAKALGLTIPQSTLIRADGATAFNDAVAITRQLKALNVNPRMVGLTGGWTCPSFTRSWGVMPSSSTAPPRGCLSSLTFGPAA